MFPKYRDKLIEDEDLKTTNNWRLGPEERQNAPRAWFSKPCTYGIYHAPRAWFLLHYHASKGFPMRPVNAKSRGAIVFSCFYFG